MIPGSGRSAGEGICYPLQYSWASLVAQLVNNLPAMQKTWFDPWVGKILWRRERLPTPVFWSGEFHGLYSPQGHKESGTTERLSVHFTANVISLEFSFISYSYKCIFLSCRNGSYTSIHMLPKL